MRDSRSSASLHNPFIDFAQSVSILSFALMKLEYKVIIMLFLLCSGAALALRVKHEHPQRQVSGVQSMSLQATSYSY